jgi:malonate transporter and related proteins
MLDILSITGPIYIAIALGYLSTRAGWFTRADMRTFGNFVIRLALPALLFHSLARRDIDDILNGRYLLIYAAGSLLAMGLAMAWARRREDATSSAYFGMGSACPNSGFVGYPIGLLVIGPAAGVLLGLNMIVENLLLIPLALALADRSADPRSHWADSARQSLTGLVRNPMVLGLVAGFAVSLAGLQMPQPLDRTVTLFAQASGALSLFVIGGSLAGPRVTGVARQVVTIAVGKLLLHPAVMLLVLLGAEALGLAPLSPDMRLGLVLTAACPMMGIFPILAQRHGREALAASALLVTTVASFFSISALLWALRHLPGWGL